MRKLISRSCEKMADRFPELSENYSTSLVDRKNSENTKKGTKLALNVFREYLKERKVGEESLVSSTRRTSWRMHTAISRKFVKNKVHATIPKGNMGYDQYTVSNDCSCRTYFCYFPSALANIYQWPPVRFF